MKLLKTSQKEKKIILRPETLDDFWHLERIIEKGDLVKGKTSRKIKGKEEGEKTIREKMFVQIEVESIEYRETGESLNINGKITWGKPEELTELGVYHSLDVEKGQKLEIIKKEWKNFHIERIKKAEKATHKEPLFVIILDDESAYFYILKEFGVQEKANIRSKKQGKQFKELNWKHEYFKQILSKTNETKPKKVIMAGPGFMREELNEYFKENNFEAKIYSFAIGSTGTPGINELLQGKQISSVVKDMELLRETKLVEKLFIEIGKQSGLYVYGLKDVENANNLGAIETLIVSDKYFLKKNETVQKIMAESEKKNSNVHIINSKNEAGKKLESLGSIAALLRFKIS